MPGTGMSSSYQAVSSKEWRLPVLWPGNLDETTTGEIIELLKQTAHELGKCVIVVTHSREVAQAADHILKLDHGTLI